MKIIKLDRLGDGTMYKVTVQQDSQSFEFNVTTATLNSPDAEMIIRGRVSELIREQTFDPATLLGKEL